VKTRHKTTESSMACDAGAGKQPDLQLWFERGMDGVLSIDAKVGLLDTTGAEEAQLSNSDSSQPSRHSILEVGRATTYTIHWSNIANPTEYLVQL
jgi:hypothetical protein